GFVAGSHIPAGAMPDIESMLVGSSHGHDRVLRDWKVWRDKTRVSRSVLAEDARRERAPETTGSVAEPRGVHPLGPRPNAAPGPGLSKEGPEHGRAGWKWHTLGRP